MKPALFAALLCAAPFAVADELLHMPDGGTCWRNVNGFVYGCTHPNTAPPAVVQRPARIVEKPVVVRETRTVYEGPTQAQVDAAVAKAIEDQTAAETASRQQARAVAADRGAAEKARASRIAYYASPEGQTYLASKQCRALPGSRELFICTHADGSTETTNVP